MLATSEGDLRRAITYLQSAATLVNAADPTLTEEPSKKKRKVVEDDDDEDEEMVDSEPKSTTHTRITVKIVDEIAGVVPSTWIDKLMSVIHPSTSKKTRPSYSDISEVITDLIAEGYSANQLIGQLYKAVLYDETISNSHKNKIVALFSEADKKLIDGADEQLTMLDTSLRTAGILVKA